MQKLFYVLLFLLVTFSVIFAATLQVPKQYPNGELGRLAELVLTMGGIII